VKLLPFCLPYFVTIANKGGAKFPFFFYFVSSHQPFVGFSLPLFFSLFFITLTSGGSLQPPLLFAFVSPHEQPIVKFFFFVYHHHNNLSFFVLIRLIAIRGSEAPTFFFLLHDPNNHARGASLSTFFFVYMVITTIIKGNETPLGFFGRLCHTSHWEEPCFPLFFLVTIVTEGSFVPLTRPQVPCVTQKGSKELDLRKWSETWCRSQLPTLKGVEGSCWKLRD
jgi:hypothetical protein